MTEWKIPPPTRLRTMDTMKKLKTEKRKPWGLNNHIQICDLLSVESERERERQRGMYVTSDEALDYGDSGALECESKSESEDERARLGWTRATVDEAANQTQ